MFLSRIELAGFKSFAKKTVLNFNHGITAIVGPNGCGKTNIVDAIRWVLGEQKSSILRSEKMENVIFNGSLNKRRLGFAEVSLTVENTKNILPSEYSEIMFSRRLFRSGESEYLLNKKACRLKDINNLLMDSGMGPDAYSVIELSMVEMLLDDRDDFRRRLFEEASGITRYKARRHETLLKLDATRKDLVRVRDIITEVERTVKELKKQVNRTVRFDKLRRELKESERVFYNVKRQRLISRIAPRELKIQELNNQLGGLSGKIAKKEAVIEQAKGEILQKQELLADAQDVLNRFSENLRTTDSTYAKLQERADSLQDTGKRITDEIGDYKAKIDGIHRQIQSVKEESLSRRNELNAVMKTLDEVKTEHDAFLKDYKRKKSLYAGKSQQYIDIMHKLSENIRKRDSIIRDNRERDERLESLAKAKRESGAKLEALFKSRGELQERETRLSAETGAKRQEYDAESGKLSQTRSLIGDSEKEIQSRKVALESCRTKLDFLSTLVEEHGGLPGGVAALMKAKDSLPGILGTVGELVSVRKGYRMAVESALGEQAQYVVVDAWENIGNAIDYLKQAQKGRATLTALDRIPDCTHRRVKPPSAPPGAKPLLEKIRFPENLRNLMYALLHDVFVVDKEDISSVAHTDAGGEPCRIVNKKGDMCATGFLLSGGSLSEETAGVVGRRDRIAELSDEIEKVESAIRSGERRLERHLQEEQAIREKCAHIENEIDALAADTAAVSQKLGIVQFDIEQTQAHLTELESETEQLELFRKESDSLENFTRRIGELEKDRDKLQKERDSFQREEEDIERERRAIESAFTEQNSKVARLNEQIAALEKDEKRLLEQKSEFTEYTARRKKELEGIIIRKKETAQRIDELQIELENLFAGRRRHEEKVLAGSEELNRVQEEKQKDFDNYRALQKRITEIKEDIQSHREQLMAVRQELRFLEDVMRQKNVAEELIAETESALDIDELEKKILRYSRKIDEFGPVNAEALDGYNRERERFEFLRNQADDLEEAETSLIDTIEKINKTARERFLEAFEQIKQNFREIIFNSFFGDGDAELRIDETGDPLDARIEIFAQPFGKKVQSINMLSGGEKALTAIALLFAIYQVKPSPFCMFDEVDSPLDDANISRFIKMLQQFSTDTQFIVVTHNKRTMEAAESLYGVTMEESGISQLISVKINRDDEIIPAEGRIAPEYSPGS